MMTMTMNRLKYFTPLFFILFCFVTYGQTDNLTGSPYSLFGLGVNSNANVGINSSMGRGGYALNGGTFINNLNPASYGSFGDKTFIYDFGFLAEFSEIANSSTSEIRLASNFSNIAIAANINEKSAFGLSIVPFSNVGYALIGIEANIEGSLETFSSNVFGGGSLNDLRFSYGYALSQRFRFGFYASYLFGTIEESEIVNSDSGLIGETGLNIQETNNYRGFRFGLGLQMDLTPNFTIAGGVDFPTILTGRQDRLVTRTLDFAPSVVEDESDLEIDDFILPVQINSGILWQPSEKFDITMDYSLGLWDLTEQEDNVGTFVDEHTAAFGIQFVQDENSFKRAKRIKYRAGFNYNSGYLEISDMAVDSYTITAGIGIPIGSGTPSALNISYGFVNRGSTEGILVQERIHTLNVNLSLKDFWFLKRKIN